MRINKYRLQFSLIIIAITANLGIATSTERAYAQIVEESDVSPALRISPFSEQRVLQEEEVDIFEVEECVSSQIRCIDGAGNNPDNPLLGAAGTQLLRDIDPGYGDKVWTLAVRTPGPRDISNMVHYQDFSVTNEKNLSDMIWQWGQFLDHDVDLTSENKNPVEPMDILVPMDDPFFDPLTLIEANRSLYDPDTGFGDNTNGRQQINEITAFIDGSNVYGSDQVRADYLRTWEGGRLKTTPSAHGDLLPFNDAVPPLPNAGGPSDELFLAGDVRANEQVGLTALHTLFVREHNRVADAIAADAVAANDELTDEEIYQSARRIVIAEIQMITFEEFLPRLLGKNRIGRYKGYDSKIDPRISNVFATAAYRFGHSMLNSQLLRHSEDDDCDGPLPLSEAFFNPDEIWLCGIDHLIIGLTEQTAQRVDLLIDDAVRNFLFGNVGPRFDLASLNIQRGRDHGIPSYNDVRKGLGLEPRTSFDEMTNDLDMADRMEMAFPDGPDDSDPWSALLLEDHLKGALVGETTAAILIDQFERSRAGDRLWYEGTFDQKQTKQLNGLKRIIELNTGINDIGDPWAAGE
jgi:hypothetical protein